MSSADDPLQAQHFPMRGERSADHILTFNPLWRRCDHENISSSATCKIRNFSKGSTNIHVTALDEVVSVNSFFSVAVFIGLSITSSATAASHPCVAGPSTAKSLVVFEVVAFSCFLFSSLVAHGLKLFLVLANSSIRGDAGAVAVSHRFLTFGTLSSAVGSVAGTVFLLLSMVNIIELRLGSVTCGNGWAVQAAIPLVVLVGTGVVMFTSSVVYATLH